MGLDGDSPPERGTTRDETARHSSQFVVVDTAADGIRDLVSTEEVKTRNKELQDLAVVSESARGGLQAILSSIGDAVLVVDAEARTVLANAAYHRMFDSIGDALVMEDESGTPLPPEATPQQRAARGETFSLAFIVTAAGGNRRWYEAKGHPIPGFPGGPCGVVTIRDITERGLRHLQDEWFAIVSHELRTPLAAMQAALQLAMRLLPTNADDERARRYLNQSLVQARRVGSLIEQMVDASRLQASRLSLVHDELDLVPVVTRAVETARMLARGQVIELEAPAGPLTIHGDGSRIEQVLLNLLSNAIAYAPKTKRIDVRLRQVIDLAEIEVQDYGPGIAEDQLPNIFDRLRRLEQGSHSAPGGLGLGLFIARAIVTGHGGAITVQSTVGVGTTFTVQLPLLPSDRDPGV